jgi:hypothetical protein
VRRPALASRSSVEDGKRPERIGHGVRRTGSLGLLLAAFLLAFVSQAAALPAGYGIEKVSPGALAKNDADIPIQVGSVRAAADGSRVTWMEYLATPGDEGGTFPGQALATRGADGWSARGIMPPVGTDEGGATFYTTTLGYLDFADDLSKGALVQAGPALVPGAAEEQGMRNGYIRDLTGSGGYTLLTPPPLGGLTLKDTLLGYGTVLYSPAIADSTPDFSHIAFETNFLPMAEGAVGGSGGPSGFGIPNVYEWHEGQVRLVSVMPNGEPAPEGAVAGGGMRGGVFGSPDGRTPGDRIVSDDGSRIVFTVPKLGASLGYGNYLKGEVYVRIDGATTQYVSRSQRSTPDPDGSQPAQFVTASSDGRYVFISSAEKLTDDSTASVAFEGGKADLYRYDTETQVLEDLTASLPGDGQGYLGLLGSSDDGNTIYFAFGQEVYVWTNGSLRSATGSFAGEENFTNNNLYAAPQNSQRKSVVSADGRWLVVASTSELSGQPTGGTRQLFLYDRESGEMKCVSCPAQGLPSSSATTNNTVVYTDFPIIRDYYPRNFNDAGTLLTFETGDQLSSEDKNSRVDVYQYETLTGNYRLMSQGSGVHNAYITDISADGETVFFVTRERLLLEDDDGLEDLYVARYGARPPAASPMPPCEGEACQGELADPPAPQAVGSSLLAAPGQGKARRGGQCAKGAKASKAKAKAKKRGCKPRKQQKKNGSKQRAKRSAKNANANRRTNR